MELRKLRHVVALAKCGSFALAAESVHLSQPAFSRSIQSIEEEFCVKLFHRGTRKIIPTPYGKVVVARAQKILQEAKGLSRDVELMKAHEYGEVLIGVGPIPAAVLLVPVLTKLAHLHPKIRAHVEITHWRNLLTLLEAEGLDFFIADIRELLSSDQLSIVPMPKLRIGCFCRSGHPILEHRQISTEQLLTYSLASVKFPDISMAEITQAFGFGGDPQTLWSVECDNLLVLVQIALRSDVVILGPEPVFRAEVKESKLVEIKLTPRLRLFTHFGIVTRRDKMLPPAAEVLIQLAHEELALELPERKGRNASRNK